MCIVLLFFSEMHSVYGVHRMNSGYYVLESSRSVRPYQEDTVRFSRIPARRPFFLRHQRRPMPESNNPLTIAVKTEGSDDMQEESGEAKNNGNSKSKGESNGEGEAKAGNHVRDGSSVPDDLRNAWVVETFTVYKRRSGISRTKRTGTTRRS